MFTKTLLLPERKVLAIDGQARSESRRPLLLSGEHGQAGQKQPQCPEPEVVLKFDCILHI